MDRGGQYEPSAPIQYLVSVTCPLERGAVTPKSRGHMINAHSAELAGMTRRVRCGPSQGETEHSELRNDSKKRALYLLAHRPAAVSTSSVAECVGRPACSRVRGLFCCFPGDGSQDQILGHKKRERGTQRRLRGNKVKLERAADRRLEWPY